jgi:dTDP-4-dehydrorhamnose 3,5-epimerase
MEPSLEKLTEHKDNRGLFKEIYYGKEMIQWNYSESKKGVLRGMHYQEPPFGQAKLVNVLEGKIQDVVIDLLTNKVYSFILERNDQLYVPEHYAHGFLALEDSKVLYGCSEFYNPKYENGKKYDSRKYNIKWLLPEPFIMSEKDKKWN